MLMVWPFGRSASMVRSSEAIALSGSLDIPAPIVYFMQVDIETVWRAVCRPSGADEPLTGGPARTRPRPVSQTLRQRCAKARGGIDQQSDQRSIAQSDHGRDPNVANGEGFRTPALTRTVGRPRAG